MSPDLEKRVQRLENIEAINRLFQSYRESLDGRDAAAYARVYTKDGICKLPDGRLAQGWDELEALVACLAGTEISREAGHDFHLYSNPVIDIDGDRATCQMTWAFLQSNENGLPQITKLGRYDAVVVRVDGEWKFERRNSTMLLGA